MSQKTVAAAAASLSIFIMHVIFLSTWYHLQSVVYRYNGTLFFLRVKVFVTPPNFSYTISSQSAKLPLA